MEGKHTDYKVIDDHEFTQAEFEALAAVVDVRRKEIALANIEDVGMKSARCIRLSTMIESTDEVSTELVEALRDGSAMALVIIEMRMIVAQLYVEIQNLKGDDETVEIVRTH